MRKIVNVFNQKEVEIFTNEFIVVAESITKENLHIEILKFLRHLGIRIDNAESFKKLYEAIETRYL